MAFIQTQPGKKSLPKMFGAFSSRWRAKLRSSVSVPLASCFRTRKRGRSRYLKRQPLCRSHTLDKRRKENAIDPARLADPDPADPFFGERSGDAVLETIEIATEGEDCDECVRKLRPTLKRISGVRDVKVDVEHERVIVTFDPRKTHAPDLHDAILKSGYKPAPMAD